MAEELTRADLRRLAGELDSTGKVDIESKAPETEDVDSDVDEAEDSSPSQEELEAKFKRERKEKGEKDDDDSDESDSDDEQEDEEESSESSAEKKLLDKKQKDKERFEKNWKGLNERSEALKRKEAELAEKEKQLASGNGAAIKRIRTMEDVREAKDKDGFSVADYEYAAKKFEEDGEPEKAETLKKQGQQLFVKIFTDEWTRNTNEMIEEHPELSDSKKPLTQAVNKCLEALPFLKMVPDGIRYAVRISLGDSSAALLSELKSENRKLKKQLEKASRRTRLVGSGPSRGETIPFDGQDVLSLPKDQRKRYLRELAAAADGE